MNRRACILLSVVAITAVSCGGNGDERAATGTARASADASSVPTTEPAPTTTVSIPLYSFDNSVPPPKLIQTGTDYKAILNSLIDYGNWVDSHHPDSALISNFATVGSPIAKGFENDVAILREDNQRIYETNSAPPDIQEISHTANAYSARYVQHMTSHVVVDARGEEYGHKVITAPVTKYVVVMARLRDGRWYLTSVREDG